MEAHIDFNNVCDILKEYDGKAKIIFNDGQWMVSPIPYDEAVRLLNNARRERIAKATLAGLLANPFIAEKWESDRGLGDQDLDFFSRNAVKAADALIAELNKEAKQ